MRDDCAICDEATAELRAENEKLKAMVKELEAKLSAIREAWKHLNADLQPWKNCFSYTAQKMEDALK